MQCRIIANFKLQNDSANWSVVYKRKGNYKTIAYSEKISSQDMDHLFFLIVFYSIFLLHPQKNGEITYLCK